MATKKTILYSVANDANGTLVNAIGAHKGSNYYCPICDYELVLRKSGNTGKNSKRPHFAHKQLTQNCTPETALHFIFKTQAFNYIKRLLNSNSPLNFSWLCQHCTEVHQGNLLKNISDVRLEYKLDECQPDIGLLDSFGKVFAVLEIVVTHSPDKHVVKYYKKNNIISIQYYLIDDSVLNNIDAKLATPDLVSVCYNPKCRDCGRYLHKLKMMVIDASCYRCGSDIKCAAIYSPNGGSVRGGSNYLSPTGFTQEEIAFARSKGVILKKRYSKTSRGSYLANTCSNCNAFVGDHYLFIDYISQVGNGDIVSQDYEIGYDCQYCSSDWKEEDS
jgi:hypothetical protein